MPKRHNCSKRWIPLHRSLLRYRLVLLFISCQASLLREEACVSRARATPGRWKEHAGPDEPRQAMYVTADSQSSHSKRQSPTQMRMTFRMCMFLYRKIIGQEGTEQGLKVHHLITVTAVTPARVLRMVCRSLKPLSTHIRLLLLQDATVDALLGYK